MTSLSRRSGSGLTLSEFISHIPDELDVDAVGIWHLVPIAEGDFGLSGADLISFLHRAIIALIDAGAVPVRPAPGSGIEWVRQQEYGETPDQIADAVIEEWKTIPNNTIAQITHCPWFARPISGNPKYVKMG